MNAHRWRGVWLGSLLTVVSSFCLIGCQSLSAGGSGGGGSVVVGTASLAFGTVAVGSSKTLADTLSNNTAASVTISSISGSSSDLQMLGISQPLVLGAGQSVPFSVKFQPSATGTLSRTISLLRANSDVLVSLTASGASAPPDPGGVVPGQLTANPTSLAFGSERKRLFEPGRGGDPEPLGRASGATLLREPRPSPPRKTGFRGTD